MGEKSSGNENKADYQARMLRGIINRVNKSKGGGTDFNFSNIQDYKNEAEKNLSANYFGVKDEANRLFSNVENLALDLNTQSMSNTEFGDINLSNLESGVSKKAQSDFMEQMKTIFENRKKAILDRTLRPGQAATRGQML